MNIPAESPQRAGLRSPSGGVRASANHASGRSGSPERRGTAGRWRSEAWACHPSARRCLCLGKWLHKELTAHNGPRGVFITHRQQIVLREPLTPRLLNYAALSPLNDSSQRLRWEERPDRSAAAAASSSPVSRPGSDVPAAAETGSSARVSP